MHECTLKKGSTRANSSLNVLIVEGLNDKNFLAL
jgi:hypothetical protein